MDDPVRSERFDQDGDSGNKRRGWRSRFALVLLVSLIVVGYLVMFLAFDSWYRG